MSTRIEISDSPVCRLCGGRGCFLWEKDGRQAYRCGRCRFIFVYPIPEGALTDDFSHAESILKNKGHFRSEYNRFLDGVEALIRPGRLLDIGCNIGLALVVARERGWEPIGIELSADAARYGREQLGVEIREVPLEDSGFRDGSFDAVVMYHALEHVVEPVRMLSEIARILKPGGILYASVPNMGGISGYLLRERWGWVSKDHLSYFTRGTLTAAIRKAGLTPARIASYLGVRIGPSKPWWESRFIDRISDRLCLSLSLESWSRKQGEEAHCPEPRTRR